MTTFSSKFAIGWARTFQILMPALTLAFVPSHDHGFDLVWCLCLVIFEVFAWRTVRGHLSEDGFTYFRVWGPQTVAWNKIRTVRIWSITTTLVLRVTEGGFFILPDCSNAYLVTGERDVNELIEVTRLRERLVGYLW